MVMTETHDSVELGIELIEKVLDRKSAPELCKGCINNESFGKECWFYWEAKKVCPQYAHNS